MVVVFMKSLKKGLLFRSPIVLKDRIEAEAVKPSSGSLEHLIGKTGKTLTPLRPSGIAVIDGQRYSVETQAMFIDRDSEVTVLKVDGTKITVQ
jgi:membrane-bound serine protease (ClpP class)